MVSSDLFSGDSSAAAFNRHLTISMMDRKSQNGESRSFGQALLIYLSI
jgi:hypothetical protein